MNEDQATLQEFDGQARLFPLPGLVFFPHAVQPLHIFEPRYRQMAADALAGDKLIALVLLKPGWEETYDDRPAVHPVACLGRVIGDQQLPDGRYNLVLKGLARVQIRSEPKSHKLFRTAVVDVLQDTVPNDVEELMTLRTAVADLILPRVTEGNVREQLRGLFKGELPLGHLCDVLAFALPLPPEAKQELLGILDVTERARELMEAFRAVVDGAAKTVVSGAAKRFPPDFSAN
ncbi:MAG TPA: LON peptidase substrate-binding domain-containing protein [Gemmataceae bacterium]|nr:LON peptidase substrate-binding domain-containing protein [Gemmataceae bacterium]